MPLVTRRLLVVLAVALLPTEATGAAYRLQFAPGAAVLLDASPNDVGDATGLDLWRWALTADWAKAAAFTIEGAGRGDQCADLQRARVLAIAAAVATSDALGAARVLGASLALSGAGPCGDYLTLAALPSAVSLSPCDYRIEFTDLKWPLEAGTGASLWLPIETPIFDLANGQNARVTDAGTTTWAWRLLITENAAGELALADAGAVIDGAEILSAAVVCGQSAGPTMQSILDRAEKTQEDLAWLLTEAIALADAGTRDLGFGGDPLPDQIVIRQAPEEQSSDAVVVRITP